MDGVNASHQETNLATRGVNDAVSVFMSLGCCQNCMRDVFYPGRALHVRTLTPHAGIAEKYLRLYFVQLVAHDWLVMESWRLLKYCVCSCVPPVAHGIQAKHQPAADCSDETHSQHQTICKGKESL